MGFSREVNKTFMATVVLAGIAILFCDAVWSSDDELPGDTCNAMVADSDGSLEALKPCIESKYRDRVATGIFLLGQNDDPRVPDLLLKIWRGEDLSMFNAETGYLQDYAVKLQAVKWLLIRKIGDKNDYVGFINEQLKNPDAYVRHEAVTALGIVGDESAIELLGKFVKYDYPDVSLAALIGIINISKGGAEQKKAIDALESLYNERDEIASWPTKAQLERMFKNDKEQKERERKRAM